MTIFACVLNATNNMTNNSKNKTIAVIIPAYNYAHFLEDCVDSVVAQTHKADEIIIVNDGSTDNTKEVALQIIKKYEKQNIAYIEKENGGLSSARNHGIRFANSEFICCLDADDMLRPDAIKEHMKMADENSISQCGLMYFGAQVATFRPQGATLESLLKTNSVYCNSVFPKKAWEGVEYDESETMRLGLEDWLFWVELAAKGYKVKTSDYIALLYRRHANTMTKSTTHPNWDKITAYMKSKIETKYGLKTSFHKINVV